MFAANLHKIKTPAKIVGAVELFLEQVESFLETTSDYCSSFSSAVPNMAY